LLYLPNLLILSRTNEQICNSNLQSSTIQNKTAAQVFKFFSHFLSLSLDHQKWNANSLWTVSLLSGNELGEIIFQRYLSTISKFEIVHVQQDLLVISLLFH